MSEIKYNLKIFIKEMGVWEVDNISYDAGTTSFSIEPEGIYVRQGENRVFMPMHTIERVIYEETTNG